MNQSPETCIAFISDALAVIFAADPGTPAERHDVADSLLDLCPSLASDVNEFLHSTDDSATTVFRDQVAAALTAVTLIGLGMSDTPPF